MNNYSGQRLFDSWYIPDFNNPLGRGSFGVVYELLSYNEIMKPTAVKIISIPASEQEYAAQLNEVGATREDVNAKFTKTKDKLLNEIAIMLQVSGHSNCVSCMSYCVIQHEGCFGWDVLIQMEKLTSLDSYYRRKGVITNTDIIRLGMDMCSALTICKANDIIHRDIKPANIMVKEVGKTVYYKLTDFGVACTLRNSGTMSIAGTMEYMAPELLMGGGDARVDIYSLGMVLYELLNANRMPFMPDYPAAYTDEDVGQARTRRLHGETLPEPLYASGTLLGRIIKKACAYKPEDRYQSAQEMQDALKQALRRNGSRVIFMVPPVGRYEPTERKKRENAPKEPKLQPEQTKKEEPVKQEPKPWKKIAIIAAACAAAVCAAALLVRLGAKSEPTVSTVQTIAASTAATAAPTTLPPTTEAETISTATEAPTHGGDNHYANDGSSATEASTEATTAQNTIAAQSYRLIAAGAYHSVWVHEDGTVEAVGRSNKKRLDVDGWDEVIEVDAASHTAALRSDGTVYVTGPTGAGSQKDVSDWSNIVHIAVGENNTMGLCADGTVRIVGSNKKKQLEASQWTGITSIAMGEDTAYGVTQDGHVVAAGSDSSGQRSGVSDWSDIVAVSAGYKYVVGLCADGRVVAAGGNSYGQCDVGSWRNIVAISAGNNFAVGLCADGTVVMAGADNYDIEETIKSWTDIVAIDAGMTHVIALRSDGTLLAAGSNGYGQCDVTSR